MKKLSLLIVLMFVLTGAFVMAEEAEDAGQGLVVSGSVTFSFTDADTAEEPTGAFESTTTSAIADLAVSSANEKVQAGLSVDLTPSIELVEGDDPLAFTTGDVEDGNVAYYDQLIDAYNWYEGNKADMTATVAWDNTEVFAGLTNAAALETAVKAGTDSDDLTWDEDLIVDSNQALGQAASAIVTALNSDANDIAGVTGYDVTEGRGYIYEDELGDAEDEALQDVQDLWDDFSDSVLGPDTDDAWVASHPIKNAYLKVLGVGGVADLMFEINGKAIAVGSMVTSDASAADDANLGFSAALSEGVVEGVSASVLMTAGGGAASVDNDAETYELETAAADPTVWGTKVSAGYATDMFGVDAAMAMEDISETANMMFSVMPSLTMTDMYGLSLKGEFNALLSDDDTGMGYGASLSVDVMGISPSVSFYGKNAAYGGDDSSNLDGTDDVTTDSGLMAQFNSIDQSDAMAIDMAITADMTELMGQKLLTVGGGYAMMLDTYEESGWNASLGLDFAEVLAAPLTAGFKVSKWAEEDLVWAGNLGYTFDEIMNISAVLEQPEAEVLSYTLSATVKF